MYRFSNGSTMWQYFYVGCYTHFLEQLCVKYDHLTIPNIDILRRNFNTKNSFVFNVFNFMD